MQSYIEDHGIEGLQFEFFNSEAEDWYGPLKPYTLLEYEWIYDHIEFVGQIVFDAGAHHGNYAVVFKGANKVYCFEKVLNYCSFAAKNLHLNGMSHYSEVVNTTLSKDLLTGATVSDDPDIYKMDIEGDEFEVLPLEIKANPQVHTWIIEIHPHAGNPADLDKLFVGYELFKVDRELMKVRPYVLGEPWPGHATLIATKQVIHEKG